LPVYTESGLPLGHIETRLMDASTLPHVFISYVSENLGHVRQLRDSLARQGIEVWLDRERIQPGSRWKHAIRRAIRRGEFFIACFSTEYASRTKTYMNEELTLAIDELRQYPQTQTWFIPVRLSECDIPDIDIGGGQSLRDIQWVDLFANWEAGVERVLSVIRPIPERIKTLLYVLRSNDQEIRERAINVLVDMNAQVAEPMLIGIASSQYDPLRRTAIAALGRIGGSRSASVLAEIANEDERVAESTVSALGDMGSCGFPHLIRVAQSGTRRARRKAIHVLGSVPASYNVVDTLRMSLDDADKDNRLAAVGAIASIGTSEATSLLRSALSHQDSTVRYQVAKTLLARGIVTSTIVENLRLSCHSTDLSFPGNIPSNARVFERITSLGKAAVPPLVHLWKHGDERQKRAAGMLLRAIGADAVPDEVWKEVEHLPALDYTDYSIPG